MKRRQFIEMCGAAAVAGIPALSLADDKKRKRSSSSSSGVPANTGASGRVVVIGGGMGGATVAKFLRLWGGQGVQVTLVERSSFYISSIMSNLVLNQQRTIEELYFGYDALKANYGIAVENDSVVDIDPVGKKVWLEGGKVLDFDRLVVAPGIDFDLLPGLDAGDYDTLFPHAWKGGAQTTLLGQQIRAMQSGETFVMTIPKAPYRCPPGPYERACLVADWLKKNRPGARVVVLDANPAIMAEAHTFQNAFDVIHRGVIDYIPNAEIDHIDRSNRMVYTSMGAWNGRVINPIPSQRAGSIAADTGLVNVNDRWAGVDVLSYQSTVAGAESVHVIGDASATTQPKAGHIANAEAKVCADAITRLLSGMSPDPSPVTNSACYSPITSNTASWLTAVFGYDPATQTMKVVPNASGEAAAPSKNNYEQMNKWFKALMADTFV